VLKTAETIEFETDEVTWMSLDVSPDGRTVVFELLGDIYTMPIEPAGRPRASSAAVLREPAHLFARRQDHRVSERPHGRREPVDCRRRRQSNPRAVSKDGKTNDRPQIMVVARVDARRRVPRRVEVASAGAGHLRLFMYHRDGGTGVRVGATPAAAARTGCQGPPPRRQPTGWAPSCRPTAASSTTRSARHLHVQRAFPLWQIYRHDRETGDVAGDQRAGQRHAPRALARRHAPGLRHAPQDRRPALRVRNLETGAERWLDLPGHARRPGIARQPRHAAALRLHARRPLAARARSAASSTASTSRPAPRTPIPFTARVQAEIAPRAYTPSAWTTATRCARG
jgi:hypothetical protein